MARIRTIKPEFWTAEQVMDIARLANLRMWEAYKRVEDARGDSEFWRQRAKDAA